MMNTRIGQEFGAYRLLSLLGRSTYAEVYLGEHRRVQGQAAIKLFTLPSTPWGWTVFEQACKKASGLVHPRIARVLDFDQQAGISFLVPLKTVVDNVQQVAEALHYAHRQHMFHLGIKPANLLLNQHQEVVVSDFGISTFAHPVLPPQMSMAAESITYMAPEQLQGQAGPASDQYALAVCAYQWLRGALPFQGNTSEIMTGHLSLQPPPLLLDVPGLPVAVEQVLLTALSKHPAERFSTIQAFSQALEQANNQTGRVYTIAPAPHLPPSQLRTQAVPTPVSPSPLGRASQSMAGDPTPSIPVAVTPMPSPPTLLAQPQLQAPSRQDHVAYPPYPQALPPTPTPQRVSRRAVIGGALGVGAASVFATLCTHTAWLSYVGKSFGSSAGATPTVAPNPLLYTFRGNKSQSRIFWSPDSTKLISWTNNETYLWDALTGGNSSKLSHGSGDSSLLSDLSLSAASWTPNGPCLVWESIGENDIYHVTNIISGTDISTYIPYSHDIYNNSTSFNAYGWSPDGKTVAGILGGGPYGVDIWDPVAGKKVANFQVPPHKVWSMSWSPDSTRIAICFTNGGIYIWDVASRTQITSYQRYVQTYPTQSAADKIYLPATLWSPNGKYIVTDNGNGGSDIWNTQNGTYKFTCHGEPQGWSADSSMFLTSVKSSAALNENACIWNINSQRLLHTLQDAMLGPRFAWAPEGSHLLLGEIIWDAASGQKVTTDLYDSNMEAPEYFSWSPNGKYIAMSYEDGAVRVWKAT